MPVYSGRGGVFIDVGPGSRCVGDSHCILRNRDRCVCGATSRSQWVIGEWPAKALQDEKS